MPSSLEDLLVQAAGGTPTPAIDSEPEVAPEETPEETPTEPEETPTPAEPAPAEPENVEPKKNPMKEVRDRLNKETKEKERIQNAIQRFTDGDYKFKIRDFKTDGKVDYDALIKAMDDADLNTRANNRGMTPEIQAEIERIEREKQELQKERLKNAMDRAVANMQTDMNLKSEDVNKFFNDAITANKNPYQWLAQGGSLEDLYYLIYKDNVINVAVEKAVAEAKAKWEKELNTTPPTTNPANPAPTNKSTMSLNDLLIEASKRAR